MKHLLCAIILLPFAVLAAGGSHPLAETVVLVVNTRDAQALRVARHYQQARGIPPGNLIRIATEPTQEIARATFITEVFNPILRQLVGQNLIEAGIDEEPDTFGRLRPTIYRNTLRYLVLCPGVPVHITEQAVLDDTGERAAWFAGNAALAEQQTSLAARNEASVDGELALLLKPGAPLTGFVPNPLFRQIKEPVGHDILRVTRLDGPDARAAQGLVDQALLAERHGLKGRAYVDLDQRGEGYAQGNEWLRRVARMFQDLGFDTSVDERSQVFADSSRFDAPVLYAGWYAQDMRGPFTLPGFRFPPGAVAVHLHSFSAQHLRQDERRWVGPLVARGVTATLGNTAEPFLALTHHLDIFFQALGNGWNLGDAAYLALPGLSWQALVVGDPLYQPFTTGLAEQLANLGEPENMFLDPYAIIRAINLELAAGRQEEALRLGRRQIFSSPSAALALKVAQLQAAAGQTGAARRTLSFLTLLRAPLNTELMVFAEAADFLPLVGGHSEALQIYGNLLDSSRLPREIELELLRRGIDVANAAGNPEQAMAWTQRRAVLQTPAR
jgi:uncharacterized protein (TIGR03790 family)